MRFIKSFDVHPLPHQMIVNPDVRVKLCEHLNTYIELHCHSYYSLLDGASSPENLIQRAGVLDMPALALTDHDGLYGAVEFWRAARDAGLHPLIGAEMTLYNGSHLTLLAETQAGYSNLCRLISRAQLAGQKTEPVLTWGLLQAHATGLICLSGCRQGPVAHAVRAKDYRRAEEVARQLRDTFGPASFFIELQRHLLPDDGRLTHLLARLANHVGAGVVATNNVHYATPAGQPLHDVLTCLPVRGTQTGRLLVVTGTVERRHGVVNVIAHHVRGTSPTDSG